MRYWLAILLVAQMLATEEAVKPPSAPVEEVEAATPDGEAALERIRLVVAQDDRALAAAKLAKQEKKLQESEAKEEAQALAEAAWQKELAVLRNYAAGKQAEFARDPFFALLSDVGQVEIEIVLGKIRSGALRGITYAEYMMFPRSIRVFYQSWFPELIGRNPGSGDPNPPPVKKAPAPSKTPALNKTPGTAHRVVVPPSERDEPNSRLPDGRRKRGK